MGVARSRSGVGGVPGVSGILHLGLTALVALSWAATEGAEAAERVLCDVEDPENECPGPSCVCVDDRLEVTFDGVSSVLELDGFTEGATIEAVVVMDVVSTPVHGWQYGVAHDVGLLTVTSVTTEGTDASALMVDFDRLELEDVQTCLTEGCSRDEAAGERVDGGGWISTIVVDFLGAVVMPVGRSTIARATYSLDRDVGRAGTTLEITDLLARRDASRIVNALTVDGKNRQWRTVADGWIRVVGAEPGELRRHYCDLEDPWLNCADPRCTCSDDALEVTFDGETDSILEYDAFEEAMPIDVVVVMNGVSDPIQGWLYGIAHDVEALSVTWATTEGTDAGAILARGGGFDATSSETIQTCLTQGCSKDEEDGERIDGGGWISAVVTDFMGVAVLPVGRNSIARAHYTLQRDVGVEGTVLEVTDRLAKRGAPRIEANVTVDGKRRVWNTVTDGWIRLSAVDDVPFRRGDVGVSRPGDEHPADGSVNIGDAVRILSQLFWNEEGFVFDCEKAADVDDDGQVSINDPMVLLNFLFMDGARPPEPIEAPGLDGSPDDLTCARYPS